MNEKKELPTLLHLNDDCLYNIFTKLSIKVQLQLANTCERFRFIITHMIWRTQFQETSTHDDVTNHLNNEQYQDLFHHIVEHIEKFTIAKNKRLMRPEPAFYLCSCFPRLIHLKCHDRRINNSLMRLIVENCPKLQVLKVSSVDITGAHIKDMLNLRELYLPNCSLSFTDLRDVFEHLSLTHLDVTCSRVVPIPFYYNLDFSKLRYLKLSEIQIAIDFSEKCSYLRNLDCLTVTNLENNGPPSFWRELYENLGASIVSLKIYNVKHTWNCMYAFAVNSSKLIALEKIYFKGSLDTGIINDFARLPALNEFQQLCYKRSSQHNLLDFISKSKYLQRFDLWCSSIASDKYFDFLPWLEIIKVLRIQKGRSTLCLNLVYSFPRNRIFEDRMRNIKRHVLEDVRYVNQSLLKITFNMPPIKNTNTFYHYIEIHFNKESTNS